MHGEKRCGSAPLVVFGCWASTNEAKYCQAPSTVAGQRFLSEAEEEEEESAGEGVLPVVQLLQLPIRLASEFKLLKRDRADVVEAVVHVVPAGVGIEGYRGELDDAHAERDRERVGDLGD